MFSFIYNTLFNIYNYYMNPHLFIRCNVCLQFVLKSDVAYLTCKDCKEKNKDNLDDMLLATEPDNV